MNSTSATLFQVEVFRTNVRHRRHATALLRRLQDHLPAHRLSFDLDDVDKIFRVATALPTIDIPFIIAFFQHNGFHCEPLED